MPPIQHSYTKALRQFSITHDVVSRGSLHVGYDDEDFLEALRFGDLDSRYPHATIFIERYDWWGAPLVHNLLYEAACEGLSSAALFARLFRFLFVPAKNTTKSKKGQGSCDWLLQYRSVWERTTAPIEDFVRCCEAHGLALGKAGDEKTEYDNVHIVSDHLGLQLPSSLSSSSKRGGVVLAPTGCCNGAECDRLAIETIYDHARCRHAVLTATSTFGTCIAGLGEIGESYYVKPDGSFHRRATVDPIDAGTLDHQKPQITSVLQLPPSFAKPRLAFVYLMMRLSDKDILLRSIESLHRHFNVQHHYSIVIFVQNPEEWRFIHFITSVRVHVVRVDLCSGRFRPM